MTNRFQTPRSGNHNDQAHPPIHPVNYVNPQTLSADASRVYEFIVRRFLAVCSADARGSSTDIELLYGSETFHASGLIVLERNYLDIYIYDRWESTQPLPTFTLGEVFEPTEAVITEGKTGPPGYLTEPELIGLMDANGIGTDATMAEHIAKIKERAYVETRSRGTTGAARDTQTPPRGRGSRGGRGGRGGSANTTRRSGGGTVEFIPTTLGTALITAYDSLDLPTSLGKPFLRKEMEQKMREICVGTKTRAEVVRETVDGYRAVYATAEGRVEVLRDAVRRYVLGHR